MATGSMEREMSARNWEVYVASIEPDRPLPDVPSNFHALPKGFVGARDSDGRQTLQRLHAWLDRIQPSVIVIHSWVGWPVTILMPYAKRRSIPILLMGHGFGNHLMQWTSKPPFFGLGRWLRSWLFVARMPSWIQQMAGLVVLGKRPHYVRGFDHWLAKFIGYENLHVIPNSVDPLDSEGFRFRDKYKLDGKLVYLCVGGYSTRKDQLLVLESFLRAEVRGSALVFIGSSLNDYALTLKERVSKCDADILFLHSLPRNEVEAAIRECDVAVLGSRSEMQPIFLLEAMSEGKPWICPLVGAVDELEGGLVSHRSAEGLSEAMVKMTSPEYRASLGAIGRSQWKSEFSTKVVYDHWDQILHEVSAKPLK
jgi:glycosyltransferase involved in cell wall biosynthesis